MQAFSGCADSENPGPPLTGRAGAVILGSEGPAVVVGSLLRVYVLTNADRQGADLAVNFSARAEGQDACEERGCLEDQARDLIKPHTPIPFLLQRKEKKLAPSSIVSKKRANHHAADRSGDRRTTLDLSYHSSTGGASPFAPPVPGKAPRTDTVRGALGCRKTPAGFSDRVDAARCANAPSACGGRFAHLRSEKYFLRRTCRRRK